MSSTTIGVGISYRPQFLRSLLDLRLEVDHLEVLVEHSSYGGCISGQVKLLAERYPLVAHGVNQSFGTEHCRTRKAAVAATSCLAREVGVRWIGDHIAATADAVTNARQLLPVPRTEQLVRRIATNARALGRITGLPVVLEYIASSIDPGGDYPEGDFVDRILELAGCGLLVDLHNVYANGLNWRRDPAELLAALPLCRAVQVHLAGGGWRRGVYVDSHSAPVPDVVWGLLEQTLRTSLPQAITLERDDPDAPLAEVRDDIDHARALSHDHAAGRPAVAAPAVIVEPPSRGPNIVELPRAPSVEELHRKTRNDLRNVWRLAWPAIESLVEAGLDDIADLSASEITPIGRAERALPYLVARGADRERLLLDLEVAKHQLLGRPGDRVLLTVGERRIELEMTNRFSVRVRTAGRSEETVRPVEANPPATETSTKGGECDG